MVAKRATHGAGDGVAARLLDAAHRHAVARDRGEPIAPHKHRAGRDGHAIDFAIILLDRALLLGDQRQSFALMPERFAGAAARAWKDVKAGGRDILRRR